MRTFLHLLKTLQGDLKMRGFHDEHLTGYARELSDLTERIEQYVDRKSLESE